MNEQTRPRPMVRLGKEVERLEFYLDGDMICAVWRTAFEPMVVGGFPWGQVFDGVRGFVRIYYRDGRIEEITHNERLGLNCADRK